MIHNACNKQHNTACYGGNVSAFAISSDGQPNHESFYRYQYDNLSRVTSAEYVNLLSVKDKRTGIYEYDAHGNITLLKRYGQYKAMGPRHTIVTAGGLVDELTLTYNGNQLKKADNSATIVCKNGAFFQDNKQLATEYLYDDNGNMTKDLNKKIVRIEYNLLNLPSRIQYSDSSFIMNTYDALGNKLRTTTGNNKYTVVAPGNITPAVGVISRSGTDYVGNFIYRDGVLSMVTYEGGYVVYNPQQIYQFGVNGPEYHYYVRDHLGNNVMDVKDDGTVCQQVRYYPFGQPYYIGDDNNNQPYKYNGKEYETMLSWNMSDYGARWQDPAIGRFSTIDPYSEKYYSLSPYAYCGNNPINAYDPDGKIIVFATYASQSFVDNFYIAVNYLISKGVGDLYEHLLNSSTIFTISPYTMECDRNEFNRTNLTIFWDPYGGLKTTNEILLSPATLLNHEFDHAVQYDKFPDKFLSDIIIDKDDLYHSHEEYRVISGSEQKTALSLGEITENEITRTDHSGLRYYTKMPNSTEPLNPDDLYKDEPVCFPQK